jgi:tRNA pseudouridine38-40 synthase
MRELIFARDRRLAAPTFMPDGLYLSGVEYDSSFGLPAFREAFP